MSIMKKLNELEQYLGFNIFTIVGWLYTPAFKFVLSYNEPRSYTIDLIFISKLLIIASIPWIISILAFLIFLVEQIISPKAKNKFFQNVIYKIFSRIGLTIILIFHLLLIIKI